MYLPTHFKQEHLAELFTLIQTYPLASLIVIHEGMIEANHIPLELDTSKGEFGILRGHIAKANPLFSILNHPQAAYLIFQAEQAYISPNWYQGKQQHHRVVPTWNYRVVHIQGKIKRINDEKYLRGILARLTRTHEQTQTAPWKMGDAPEDFIEQQLQHIAAIEIEISTIIGKFKVSQNRSKIDAENVANALATTDPEMSASILKFYPE